MNGVEKARKRSERGNAIVEASLFAPWLLFLFVGVFDFGFYAYALIAAENAARAAALYASANATVAKDYSGACQIALGEMRSLPNVSSSLTACDGTTGPVKLILDPPETLGPDGARSARATVNYRTVTLIPLPFMAKQLNITRTVQVRLKVN